ncbi:MAG: hypothetical protein OEN56_00315 [Gemmatimonadota bacterium]|nr:hypothetical protein [Gemmatimonadota bacterium]
MKSFAKFAVLGVSSVVLFKLLATILFPMLGLVFGLLAMTVKFALIAAVVFFLYSIFKKSRREVEEVEVEVG